PIVYVIGYLLSTRPPGSGPGQDVSMDDLLNINQSYINAPNNVLICSGRHQSAIFGVNVDSGELRFIMANHEDWSDEFKQSLLTPVDYDGVRLYDLTSPGGIDAADKIFCTWGPHTIVEFSTYASVI
ncbi:aryl-sulfate sulfotransferase, partial [Salmonella enterica]|uniref:aryl-sulfate sulfotransferase n=1 Tax=Salmonella enterica TaxID=28901 RepID=UPI00398C4177